MNEDLRFSIVIPTRERPDTLKYCLQTCVEQELFDNYEIIVSDNNSSPATKEVVNSFGSNKIKYFSTGKTLAMFDSFEFAVSKAKGEYLIVLGDDDGITLKGLHYLDKIIRKTNFKAISWQWIMYYWPEGVPLGFENLMYIPISTNVKVVNGKEAVKSVMQFKLTYNFLPMLYINSAIHRDLVSELLNVTGRVFSAITPDCYSAICMAYLSKDFLFLDRPLTIAAISGKSNGNNQLYKKSNNKINNEFNQLNELSSIQFHKQVPNVRSINALISDVFMQAKNRLFKDDEDLTLDRKLMISKILEDLTVFDEKEWYASLDIIKKTLHDDSGLESWFGELTSNYSPRLKDINHREVISPGLNFSTLVVNGFNFDCNNVYDAAKFYSNSLESEIYIPDNMNLISHNSANHQKPRSILKSIVKRFRHAGRVIIKGS